MKLLFLATVFVVVVAVKSEGNYCSDEDECDEDECCLSQGVFRKSSCTKRGFLGESCAHEDDYSSWWGKKYYKWECPCLKEFECEAEEVHEGIFGKKKYNERCVGKDVTTDVVEETDEPEEQTNEPETDEPEEETDEPEVETDEPDVETDEPEVETDEPEEE